MTDKKSRMEKFKKMAEEAGQPISDSEAHAREIEKFYNEAFSSTTVDEDEGLRKMLGDWLDRN